MRLTGLKSTYSAQYRVVMDSPTASPLAVLIASQSAGPDPVPGQYDAYLLSGSVDEGAFAQDFDVKPESDDTTTRWIVSVTWRPIDSNTSSRGDATVAPVDREARFSMEFWDEQTIISQAWNVDALVSVSEWRAANTPGPIVNAAKEQFHDAVTEDDKITVLVARKNFATLADVLTLHRNFNRTLNSDTFYGYTAHKAKFLSVELGDAVFERSYSYYPGVIKVALKDEEWYLPIVNKGMMYRKAAGAVAVAAEDANGRPVQTPVLLKADGTKLPAGEVGNTIRYRTRRAVAYSGLGIGGA